MKRKQFTDAEVDAIPLPHISLITVSCGEPVARSGDQLLEESGENKISKALWLLLEDFSGNEWELIIFVDNELVSAYF